MQPTTLLQRKSTKVTSKNLRFSFLENKRVQQGQIEKFIFSFSTIFAYNGNDLSSGYFTFVIFNNLTFFDTIQKADGTTPSPQKILLLISCVLYCGSLRNSFAIIWDRFPYIFCLVSLSFHTSVKLFSNF